MAVVNDPVAAKAERGARQCKIGYPVTGKRYGWGDSVASGAQVAGAAQLSIPTAHRDIREKLHPSHQALPQLPAAICERIVRRVLGVSMMSNLWWCC